MANIIRQLISDGFFFRKRASAMEKLNRALQAERTDLINKMKNGAKGGEGEENVAAAN